MEAAQGVLQGATSQRMDHQAAWYAPLRSIAHLPKWSLIHVLKTQSPSQGRKQPQTASATLDTTNQESSASRATQGSTRLNMALTHAQGVWRIPSALERQPYHLNAQHTPLHPESQHQSQTAYAYLGTLQRTSAAAKRVERDTTSQSQDPANAQVALQTTSAQRRQHSP